LDAPVKRFEAGIRGEPWRTLISVLLSSRTRDEVTLAALIRLFKGINQAADLAALSSRDIEKRIFPVGFYRQKARFIKEIAERIASGETLQPSIDMLTSLPGVGRKTANLVLALAFSKPAIAVDVHVFRISRRLGWCQGKTPLEVEQELEQLFERRHEWNRLNQALVAFGQTLCKPRKPLCGYCSLHEVCPSYNGKE